MRLAVSLPSIGAVAQLRRKGRAGPFTRGIGALLELSLSAVKASLHRGRLRLRQLAAAAPPDRCVADLTVARYVALFNARDWDRVRALLAQDVQLDLLSRAARRARRGRLPDEL